MAVQTEPIRGSQLSGLPLPTLLEDDGTLAVPARPIVSPLGRPMLDVYFSRAS
jgi:hypothetical protein